MYTLHRSTGQFLIEEVMGRDMKLPLQRETSFISWGNSLYVCHVHQMFIKNIDIINVITVDLLLDDDFNRLPNQCETGRQTEV